MKTQRKGYSLPSLSLWPQLERRLRDAIVDVEPMDVISECVRLFFDYIYPLIPLLHRQSFMRSLYE